MKFKIIISALTFILIAQVPAFSQTTIKAEVDKTSITTDDTVTYKLTITSSENKILQPQFPKFEGFFVLSQAQSSTISFAKSNLETLFVQVFILAPKEAGKLKIEPSQIKFQGRTYSTDSFEIDVAQGEKRPVPQPEEKPSLPQKFQPETEEPQVNL